MRLSDVSTGILRDMTSTRRPKRGQASKLTQSRLTDAFDCFGEGFVLWDADDCLVLCNRKYREFFALSADLMVRGGSFEEILRGAVALGQYAAAKSDPEGWIKIVLERRREATGSSELQLSDGRWLHVTNRRTSDGGIVGILSDITERIKHEEILRERETRLRSLMANVPGGVYRCRADWTEVLMSDGIEPITGWPAAAFCEDRRVSLSSLMHPEDRDAIHAETARRIENRSPYAVEYRLIDRGGKVHWVLDQGRPVYDNAGTLLWIDGVLFDITERKQMESEVRRLQTRMTDAIESIGEAFVLWGADERLVLCNKKYRELFDPDGKLLEPGRSLEDVIRMNVAAGRHPESAADPEGWIQDRLRRYRAAAGDSEMKIPGNRWLRVIDRRTSEGGIVGIRTDITERKNAELELRAANDSLKAAMEKLASSERMATIGQVAATVSHELRNPLGAIRNSMALVHQLTAGKQLGVERALERADRNIERCTAIISAMLEFTHEKEITRAPTPIAAWLAELMAGHPLPEGIALERDLRAADEVAIDRERFQQAILGVVDNAVQALQDPAWVPPENYPRRVTLRAESAGPHVRISIIDNGPGIPPDVLPRIFEPLFTTKGFGVGLGLPTVRQIVERHGGTIDVASAGADGTTVTIWLPRHGDAQTPPIAATDREAAA
jgi:PAS domain S-box-containing protein